MHFSTWFWKKSRENSTPFMHTADTTSATPTPCSNKHLLAALAVATQSLSLLAEEDISDEDGHVLIAKGHQLTAELLERLTRRRLDRPPETCIRVEHGVTAVDLEHAMVTMCQKSSILALTVGGEFSRLRRIFREMPLSPFALLMLSVQRRVRPESFFHALLASIVAGTLALRNERSGLDPLSAVLAGLLHDVGEMYLNPQNLVHVSDVDSARWMEISKHPEIGMQLIRECTGCPEDVARAVCEHHEMLDGSGFPRGLSGDAISPLGQLLSLVETVCRTAQAHDNQGARVRLAVSFVAGEFPPQLVHSLLAPIKGTLVAEVSLPTSFDMTSALERARSISQCLTDASAHLEHDVLSAVSTEHTRAVVDFAREHVHKLQLSWEATGIGTYFSGDLPKTSSAEEYELAYHDLDVASHELKWRMRRLSRTLAAMSHSLPPPLPGVLVAVISALEVRSRSRGQATT